MCKNKESMVICTPSGLGYEVYCSSETLLDYIENNDVELFVHTHFSENLCRLFGFKTKIELDFFKTIISVSGVGPKTGLAVLEIPICDIVLAILSNNINDITKVKGIGKKTAERIVLELKENSLLKELMEGYNENINDAKEELYEILISFGYSKKELENILSSLDYTLDIENLIKISLEKLR